jgi:hypothetical protein
VSLSSLIVQRDVATIREVEEALARQVLYGGDLVTNLLEVSRISEETLLPIVAESFGLKPAPAGELPQASDDARRLVAPEVALERNFAPISLDDEGLVLAVSEPLTKEVEQELQFVLALPIEQRIAPLIRIRQALARDYGLALDRRIARLLSRIQEGGPRTTSSFPPVRSATPDVIEPPRPPSVAPSAIVSKAPSQEELDRLAAAKGPPSTLLRKVEAPAQRPIRRRRGPLTMDAAKAELEVATHRDTVIDLLFEFARQFFDYTALFLVQGEIAEGRDAFGDGSSREKVARIGVPLDLPSILATARAKKAVYRSTPTNEGIDPVLMKDLGREGTTECVVVPVILRTRVVALILGDGGDTGIEHKSVLQVEEVGIAGAAAFERLIVRRKLKGASDPPPRSPSNMPSSPAAPMTHPSGAPPKDRPSVEELAAPIRELMAEPVSKLTATSREPTPLAAEATEKDVSPLVDPLVRTDKPPPAQLLAVRRPTGAPIPREEPETGKFSVVPKTTASRLEGDQPPLSGPAKSRSGSLKRAEAPPLEFGAHTGGAPVYAETSFGNDESERILIAQIQGQAPAPPPSPSPPRESDPPRTTRDPEPPSVVSQVDAFSHPPSSPKAVSPPPPPPRLASSVTDVSPNLPMFPAKVPSVPIEGGFPDPTPLSPPVDMTPPPPSPFDEDDGWDYDEEEEDDDDGEEPALDLLAPRSSPKPGVAPGSARRVTPPPLPAFIVPPVSSQSGRAPDTTRAHPQSEQQISVAAHKPPSSRSDHSRVLPSVIVDVSTEYVELVDKVISGPDEEAEASLLRAGGYAMPAILARFPGPITIDEERLASGAMPRVAECGPVIRLIASQRRTALPFVLSHVEDPDPEKRFWATFLLSELVYPDAIDATIARVFDDDPRVRRAARAAARALAESHPQPVVERLEVVAKDKKVPRARRILAIEALGETREASAAGALLALFDSTDPEVAAAVRASLVTITRQDFGTDAKKWSAWWAANKDRHRLEWLIDSLMHDQAALRAAAGEELKTITKEYFGYYDDLPKRERERAQSRYREWWSTIGRVRFSRPASTRG